MTVGDASRDNHRRTAGGEDIREAGERMSGTSAHARPAGGPQSADSSSLQARLDERYGRRPRPGRRRLLVALLAAVVAVAAAWAVWAAFALTRSSLTWTDAGADVTGTTAVRVSFVVRAAPGTHLVCAVRATDDTGAVVGWLDVPVVAPSSGTATPTVTVPTSQPATGGGVASCARR
jgi:Domain of unknown function (DUF4307)